MTQQLQILVLQLSWKNLLEIFCEQDFILQTKNLSRNHIPHLKGLRLYLPCCKTFITPFAGASFNIPICLTYMIMCYLYLSLLSFLFPILAFLILPVHYHYLHYLNPHPHLSNLIQSVLIHLSLVHNYS